MQGHIAVASMETLLKDHLQHCLDVAMSTHHQGCCSKQFGTALANVALTYREGIAYTPIMDHTIDFLCSNVFSPMQLARLMDIHGGTS